MSSLSLSPVSFSSASRETSAQKAIKQIPVQIRADKEKALTELFNALRTWRVNPKTYTQEEISPALKGRISALNSTSTELRSILQVALKFAKANKGKFTSNEALIAAIEQELSGLEHSSKDKKPRSSFCKKFFSFLKVAEVGMALIGAGLYASVSLRADSASNGLVPANSNGPVPANFPHYDGKPAFFKGDFLVDEQGGKPLYCPPKMRLVACPWYVRETEDILRNPVLKLAPNPYTQRAGGTIHQITVAGRPLPVAAGGERAALFYMEQCYGTESLGEPPSFGMLRLNLVRLWPNATISPLSGDY